MNHDEAIKLIGPYRDGELDLAACLKLEEHLAGCALCRKKLEEEQGLVAAIELETPRFKPSPFLKTRILAALREEQAAPASVPWWKQFSLGTMYSGLAGAAVVLFLAVIALSSSEGIPELDREGIANHVRSLQVSHLMDVVSTDQHTVKPWFAGKLDYSPQVIDLGPSGYPLVGGRLDVLDHRDVAAIIYQRRKHYINLFIWPAGTDSLKGKIYNEDGYHAMGWTKSGMNYLAVSELGEKELKDFIGMIQEQTIDTRPGE
jgi:anti-sigma factor RsiW